MSLSNPVEPMKKGKKVKLEDYELDNHVRTLTEAQKICDDKDLCKMVHKHAKKQKSALGKISKMMKNDDMEDEMEEEKKEMKSIDDIRARRKKIKSKIMVE